MNLNEKNLELQVQIWALIGPVIALATVITLFFQGASENVVLGLAILLGMLACWWWKTKGLMGALIGITLLGSYQFLNQPADEPLWNIGITCAIALTFLITALSFEEVETIVEGIQSESSSRLKSLLKLDEKLERVQSKLQEEKKTLLNIVKDREQELQHQEKIIELSREEIIFSQKRNEELLTEIYSLKIHQQNEKELSQEEPASLEVLKEMEELRYELTLSEDQFVAQSRELEHLKSELMHVKQQVLEKVKVEETLQSELNQTKKLFITQSDDVGYAQIEIETLQGELKIAVQNLQHLMAERNKFEQNIEAGQQELQSLKTQVATLQEKLSIKTQEASVREEERLALQEQLQSELSRIQKEANEQTEKDRAELEAIKTQLETVGKVTIAEAESRELRRIDGLYRQLRLQFEEKSALLDATRKELFLTQERLTRELMDQKEKQYEGTDYERELQNCLDQLEAEQRELTYAHRQEVEQLQELISQMMCCA